MKFMTKIIGLIALFVLVFAMAPQANAQSVNYDIKEIFVNGLEVLDTGSADIHIDSLDVERGDRVSVRVVIEAADDIPGDVLDDVIVRARISGYEYGTIDDETKIFSMDEGQTFVKELFLSIPKDIDASEIYTLRIEVEDKNDEQEYNFDLHVDEQRNNINVFNAFLNPSSMIKAGKPLFVSIMLENLGEKDQDIVEITVSIPELGVRTSQFVKEIVSQRTEEDEEYRDDEEAQRKVDALLRIPENAQTGTYDVMIDVTYNRGHDKVTEVLKVNVEGVEMEEGVKTIINTDSTSKKAEPAKEVTYRLMVANLGDEPGLYSVQVDGVSSWGELRVEPGFLNVLPQSTGEVLVRITPFDSEETESHTWVARILLGNEILNEVTFNTNVEVEEVVVEEKTTGTTFKTVLAIVFGVLVVVLIILGLIIAFRKMDDDGSDDDAEPGTPGIAEGQTYYYYPKK